MVPPKSNAANVAKYKRNDAKLIEIGWEPVRVWENEDREVVAERIAWRWHAGATRSGSSDTH